MLRAIATWPRLQLLSGMATPQEVIYKLADAARDAWVWVRQPADDPVVRARTAFDRIEASGEIPGFQWPASDVRVAIKDRQAMTDVLRILGENKDALIYVLIANVALERLQSGQHHVARGRLSPKGRQIRSAYKHAAARLIQFGVYDQATYAEDCALLRRESRKSGRVGPDQRDDAAASVWAGMRDFERLSIRDQFNRVGWHP